MKRRGLDPDSEKRKEAKDGVSGCGGRCLGKRLLDVALGQRTAMARDEIETESLTREGIGADR
jgi:hypothetical protein